MPAHLSVLKFDRFMDAGADAALGGYLLQQHWRFYMLDVLTLLHAAPSADPTDFLARYLQSVATGHHVAGRSYEYISGTPYNRRSFLLAAAAALQPLAPLGPFSPGDCHSMLLLLCPDFPLSCVMNCWSAAVELGRQPGQLLGQQQPEMQGTDSSSPDRAAARSAAVEAPAKQQLDSSGANASCVTAAGAGEAGAAVPLAALLEALGTVMVHERWLLLLRRRCFDERKACCRHHAMLPAMQAAAAELRAQGWPAPGAQAQAQALLRASQHGCKRDFTFGSFVRELCCCPALRDQLRREQATVSLALQMAATVQGRWHRKLSSREVPKEARAVSRERGRENEHGARTWV